MLEVLIASGLLAIVGAFLVSALSSSIDAKEAVEDVSARYHLVRQAMSRVVDEVSMAYLSAHTVTPELRTKTGMKGEDDAVHFTAFGNVPRVEDVKESDQRELSFLLGTDERTGTQSLLRRVQPNPDDDIEEGGRTQTLLPDVVDVGFEYWDNVTEEWKEEWDTEDAATLGRLPVRVKITLTARMNETETQTFTTQTKIWLEKPWAFRN